MLVDKPPREFDGKLILSLILLVVLSCIGAWYLQPIIKGKNDAINTVVTVFSILAGFLIAVITFIAEPGKADWRQLQLGKAEVSAKLDRHLVLFYLYLATLGLAMGMFLVPNELEQLRIWLERIFLFFAIFVFGLSFSLPHSLRAIQMAKYEDAIKTNLPADLKAKPED